MKWLQSENSRQTTLLKLEFWGFVTLFVFGVIFFFWNRFSNHTPDDAPYKEGFDKAGMSFNYYKNFIIPVFVEFFFFNLGGFALINFILVPRLFRKEQILKNIALIILVFLGLGLADAITDRFTHSYRFIENSGYDTTRLTIMSFLSPVRTFIMIGLYTLLKYTALYFINNKKASESRYAFIQRDTINAFVVWLISMFVLVILDAGKPVLLTWGIVAPIGILLYAASFYSLIPRSLRKSRSFLHYMVKVALVMLLFIFPVFFLAVLATRSEQTAGGITSFNYAVQLLITAPLSWIIYKRYLRSNETIQELKSELGRSHARLDFLRSQINPHFLFNAMNTLYGTAIQENAGRTSEGIQKLSDMMRFMLQENMQEKISLSREIDYLNNYIDLQRLRTETTPGIRIDVNIPPVESIYQIAPMLLIPFVENAFKHGISFREPSYIRVSLEIRNQTLYFDVQNSTHPRKENDPEKYKSGIGLDNVRQRLQLLYPNKHELEIRESEKEFFVHLVLQLN